MTTANVDPHEIAKFGELAARWWDPQSEFKPLHQINPLRLGYIEEHGALKDLKAIDIGCGGGILSESMAVSGADVVGIDLGEKALGVAKLHALEEELDIDYQLISAEEIATQQAGSFDVVTCMEMLEHVPDPASIIQACAALVKPGGRVYLSTLNRNPKAWAMAVLGAEYVLNLLPKGTHQYEKFIKPSEMNEWAEQHGLSLNAMVGMHYNPLFQTYKLAPGLDVNYLAYFTREA
ncbi:MAG: 2-polyprenyl-6-hydroxyphenyl methylase/3-demethylubiquinone-9 3-methyltransferase [Saprospiraceae bacterium]|jgi:2-polyprenyl-6-hydroxyphenyl methylase/3-demethylubiquinone-9 3-methyltransferase